MAFSAATVVQLLAVANVLVQGFTPCTIPTGNIVACGPEDICTRQLQNARKCCAIVGNCYKDRRYSLKPVFAVQNTGQNAVQNTVQNTVQNPGQNVQRYQNCLDSNNKIKMIGYRNRLVDCTQYLPAPAKPQKSKNYVDVKCISSKVKLLYAAFGLEAASQPVCKNEKPRSEVVYVKNGETPKFSSSNDNDSNKSSSDGAMGTGRAAASWYSDYYVPRGQKCREISKSLAGLQGFQSMFGGMSFSENINSRYNHYKSEYAKNQCDTVT